MTKIFRIDYYPNQAYLDFTRLEADQIGVLMQIINLIYMNQGPIENDPKWISKSISNLGPTKCARIIEFLLENDHIYLTDEGKISKRMNEKQLKNVQERREILSNSGRTAANQRWENEQNQQHKNAGRINRKMPSTSTRDRDNPLPPKGGSDLFPQSETQNENENQKGKFHETNRTYRRRSNKSDRAREAAARALETFPAPSHSPEERSAGESEDSGGDCSVL
jgi:hypothetical protein